MNFSSEEKALRSALDTLPQNQRRAVVLRFYHKQSYAGIGGNIDCSAEAARKLVDRGLKSLAKHLQHHGGPTAFAGLLPLLALPKAIATTPASPPRPTAIPPPWLRPT